MARPNATTNADAARWAASALVRLAAASGTGELTTTASHSTGDTTTPHGSPTPTVGGGSATTGATGFEAASASPAPTPPKGAEPSAAGSPAPAVLTARADFAAVGRGCTDRALPCAPEARASTHFP